MGFDLNSAFLYINYSLSDRFEPLVQITIYYISGFIIFYLSKSKMFLHNFRHLKERPKPLDIVDLRKYSLAS